MHILSSWSLRPFGPLRTPPAIHDLSGACEGGLFPLKRRTYRHIYRERVCLCFVAQPPSVARELRGAKVDLQIPRAPRDADSARSARLDRTTRERVGDGICLFVQRLGCALRSIEKRRFTRFKVIVAIVAPREELHLICKLATRCAVRVGIFFWLIDAVVITLQT